MKNSLLLTLLLNTSLSIFAQQKPNILIFFVDDLGWADVGYRNEKFNTPHINQLKKDGMDFSRAYIATPTCSPSRASLLTGREPVRFQMVRHILEDDEAKSGSVDGAFNQWFKDPVKMPSRQFLPLEEVTYAERLKEFGYYNAFVGKWHLGEKEYYPSHQGFDEEIGVTPFGHPKTFYYPFFKSDNPFSDARDGDYLTDVLTTKTQEFIKNYDKKQPFQLSLYYYNVHSPQIGRKDLIEKYKKAGLNDVEATYAAKVTAVDESVGKIRQTLKDKGIADNTIILFLSDQGGFYSNAPLSGGKIGGNTLGEGGARVPFIVYYPKVTKAHTTYDIPVQSIDIYPSLIEIASGKKCTDKQINGKSLLPVLKGKKMPERNLYFFRSYEDQYAAVISGDWKLVKYHSGQFTFFNVKNDIGEQHNLIADNLPQAEKLKKDLANWENEVLGK